MIKIFISALNVACAKAIEMLISWYIPIIFIREGGFRNWGEVAYALTINLALAAILMLGAEVLIQRMIVDRGYTKRVLFDIFRIEIVSLSLSALVIFIFLILKPFTNSNFVIALPLLLLNSYNAEHFRALLYTRVYLLILLLPSSIFALILTVWSKDSYNYIYACLIASIISTALQWRLMRSNGILQNPLVYMFRCLKFRGGFLGIKMRGTFDESVRLTKGSMAIILSKYMDITILGLFVSSNIVGMYDIALKITVLISAPLVMVAPFIITLLRKLELVQQKKKFYIVQLFCGVSAFIITMIIFNSEIMLQKFVGESVADLWPLIYILALGQLVNSITGPSGMALLANDVTLIWTKIVLYNLLLGVPIFFVSVKFLGVYGAASVNAASLIAMNLAMYYELHKLYKT